VDIDWLYNWVTAAQNNDTNDSSAKTEWESDFLQIVEKPDEITSKWIIKSLVLIEEQVIVVENILSWLHLYESGPELIPENVRKLEEYKQKETRLKDEIVEISSSSKELYLALTITTDPANQEILVDKLRKKKQKTKYILKSLKLLTDNVELQKKLWKSIVKYGDKNLIWDAALYVTDIKLQGFLIKELCRYDGIKKYLIKLLESVTDTKNQRLLIEDLIEYYHVDSNSILEILENVEDTKNQRLLLKFFIVENNKRKSILKFIKIVKNQKNQRLLIKKLCEYDGNKKYIISAIEIVTDPKNEKLLIEDLKCYELSSEDITIVLTYITSRENRNILYRVYWKNVS